MEERTIKFIPDSEINLLENDILGTSVYVETIRRIIENSETPTPYTIGLFGSWGSGKSSIIKTLKDIYEKENKNIKIFIYDAWKYSKDDFRRSFLMGFANFLNNKDVIKEVEERFYTIGIQRTTFGVSKFINLQREISKQTPNVIFPEKFADYFKELIGSITNKDKLVIAIDNIDRCHKEQAFEILLTVKTFLGHKRVIFIIPIDDKGLKSYLQMSNRDADEFLRKLFNVSIAIKSFSSSELYEFTIKLCEKYGIDFPKKEEVISLICQEFSRNPRRIIQFLNTLQVEYNLAIQQEKNGLIPSGSITDNIEMLVKLLIIREEYPELYDKIRDDKSLLQTITDDVRTNGFSKNEGEQLWTNGNIKLTEEEYRFLLRTSNIVLNESKLEPFFVVKDIFRDIPDKVEELVMSQDWDSIKKYLERGDITLDKLLHFIETKIDEDVVKRKLYDTSGFNLLSLLFKIISEKKEEIETLPSKIISCLNIKALWRNTFNYPPNELAISLKWLKDKQTIEPLNYVVEAINEISVENLAKDKKPLDLLKEFIIVFKEDENELSKIKKKFSEILSKNFPLYNDFRDILENEVIKHLLDDSFAKQIIPTLSQDFNQNNTKEKVEIIKSLNNHSILDRDTIIQYVNRYIQNAGILQNYQNWNFFGFWLEALVDLIQKVEDNNTLKNLYNFLSQNYNLLINNYNNRNLGAEQIKCYKAFVKVFGEFYLSTDNSNYRQNIITWLNAFINPIHLEVFSEVNEVYKKIIESTNNWQQFVQTIVNQLINQNNWDYKKIIIETVNLMLIKIKENEGLNHRQINQILSHYFDMLIKDNSEIEKYILEISENEFIGNKVIDYSLNLSYNDLEKSITIIDKLVDKYGFDRFYPKIRELLASSNQKEQEIGIELTYIVKGKIPVDKKSMISKLLSEIEEQNVSENVKQKLKDIEKYL